MNWLKKLVHQHVWQEIISREVDHEDLSTWEPPKREFYCVVNGCDGYINAGISGESWVPVRYIPHVDKMEVPSFWKMSRK